MDWSVDQDDHNKIKLDFFDFIFGLDVVCIYRVYCSLKTQNISLLCRFSLNVHVKQASVYACACDCVVCVSQRIISSG